MSRTLRKDLYIDKLSDRQYPASEEDKLRAHQDGKKWYKLPKKAKKLSRPMWDELDKLRLKRRAEVHATRPGELRP